MQQLIDLAGTLGVREWIGVALFAVAAWLAFGDKLGGGFAWLKGKLSTAPADKGFDDSFKALDVIAAAHKEVPEIQSLVANMAAALTAHHYPRRAA